MDAALLPDMLGYKDLADAGLTRRQFDRLIDEGLSAKDCILIAKYVNPDESLRGWTPDSDADDADTDAA